MNMKRINVCAESIPIIKTHIHLGFVNDDNGRGEMIFTIYTVFNTVCSMHTANLAKEWEMICSVLSSIAKGCITERSSLC